MNTRLEAQQGVLCEHHGVPGLFQRAKFHPPLFEFQLFLLRRNTQTKATPHDEPHTPDSR